MFNLSKKNYHGCQIPKSYCFVFLHDVQNFQKYIDILVQKWFKTFENCALLFDYLKSTEKQFQMLPKCSSQPRYN